MGAAGVPAPAASPRLWQLCDGGVLTRDDHVKQKYSPANVPGKALAGGEGSAQPAKTPDPWGTKVPWPRAWSRGQGEAPAALPAPVGPHGEQGHPPPPRSQHLPALLLPLQDHSTAATESFLF